MGHEERQKGYVGDPGLVPNKRSPASRMPGRMYPLELSWRSREAVYTGTAGWAVSMALTPSGAETRQRNRIRWAPARVRALTAATAEPPVASIGSSRKNARSASPEDRKSTRLNSSHSQISYAVFCLKKKKHR